MNTVAFEKRHGGRSRAWTIARTDLQQLRQARDFWLPLAIISSLFFVVIPGLLLVLVTHIHDVKLAKQLGDIVGALPKSLRTHVKGQKGPAEASYALAVNLFAPLAIVVPLTVSSAVGANTIIGERERGSGEFLAHSPATEREIFLGKLMASLIPGYLTAFVGFAIYSVIVNLTVGPQVGGWFFPTANWWVLMLWVLPPFVALALSLILAISARVSSAAAAQQASALVTLPLILVAYTVASGSLFEAKTLGLAVGAGRVDPRGDRALARLEGTRVASDSSGWARSLCSMRRFVAFVTLTIAAAGVLAGPLGAETRAPTAFTTGVRRITVTFVDHSRRTPANPPAHVRAAKSRTLRTTIWIPQGRGPFPLVVYAPGYGDTGAGSAGIVEPWAAAGYVVAAPDFPVASHGGARQRRCRRRRQPTR